MSDSILQVRNVSRAFGGLLAVNDVSFDVGRHRVTTIIGPNGAGKSTLFNLVSGALRMDSGSVKLAGRDVTGMSPALLQNAGMARSFQITNVFFGLTVVENIRLAAQLLERKAAMIRSVISSRRACDKVGEMLARFNLKAKESELAGNLSHGEQRRLEMAICLASEPEVLMMDEPTQGMSHGDTEETAELIRDLSKTVTVLLIEHDINLVMKLSSHIVVMHQGKKLAEGSPAEVRDNPSVQAAYFGQH
ncbi:ABC transporter ATP-binding protein [Pusillimonas sp.]|uniref:ABC transporter ATP-binding protein n=1 Tax=Pusillimonas sp. TaxID=3040095 RepID=UPI0029B1E78B|nr:ABC transporter ATP-binding protein [Pusillimonas sp.]MDX3894638.1 ABC transporter ATP-binding protein [Pusillimonas sp.]